MDANIKIQKIENAFIVFDLMNFKQYACANVAQVVKKVKELLKEETITDEIPF